MKTVAIIQARMGSSRLPGKAMLPILGKPVLQWMIDRVGMARHIDQIVVATTKNSQKIINYCHDHFIPYFIGPENDVIKRVCQAAAWAKADLIVDLTSDCPLIDPGHIDFLCLKQLQDGYLRRYASNIEPRTWPDGFDCQVYPAFLLYETENLMYKDDPKREHSGWNILQRKMLLETFKLNAVNSKFNLPNMRLTLDYKEDFQVIKSIIMHFNPQKYYGAIEIINYVLSNPKILVNKHLEEK